MSEEVRAKVWMVGMIVGPFVAIALIVFAVWARARDVGEPCAVDSECHDWLGDACLERVCSPSCDDDPCPEGWECVETYPADGRLASQLQSSNVCRAPEELRPGTRDRRLHDPDAR